MDATSVPAAIYTRKSNNRNLDLEVTSIDAQRQFGESFVAAHAGEGWEVVPERYDDPAISGATTNRPALQRLLADAKAGKFKVVVCYKLDRISRNLRDFLDITDTLQKCGVRLACVAHPIDTGTAAGRAFVNLMAVFAALEREQSAERVRDRCHAVRRRGGYIGGCTPFGYLARDKHLVPDPERSAVVKRIFESYLRFGSLRTVAESLEEQGVTRRDGHPWTTGNVARILKNRLYSGEIEFEGQIVKAANEPLVSKETWEDVQKLLRMRRSEIGRKGPVAEPHPLAGIVRCGSCGGAMVATMNRGRHNNGKVYWYYRCSKNAKSPKHTCPTRHVSGGELEKAVLDRMGSLLQSPMFLKLVGTRLRMPPAEVRRELGNVTEFWTGLFPAEKWRVMKLFLESVTVLSDEITIKIKTSGIADVMQEIRNAR